MDKENTVRKLMTTAEAADMLRVTTPAVQQAIHRGRLRGVKVNRHWYVELSEVLRYAEGTKPASGAITIRLLPAETLDVLDAEAARHNRSRSWAARAALVREAARIVAAEKRNGRKGVAK